MTPMSAAVRAQIAPTGKLRVGLNLSNFLLVRRNTPPYEGPAPDLGRELARRAGVDVELIGYENAGLVADAARTEAWDVAFIGAEPARADVISFTPAYVEIQAGYLVPAGSPIRSIDEVDRAGVKIVTTDRAAYTLYLQRTIKNAAVTTVPGQDETVARFEAGGFDVLAGLKPRLVDEEKRIAGSRVLEGRFTAIQQAMGTPKSRAAAFEYLVAFGEEIKSSGLVADLIQRHGSHGLTVAPLATK